MDKNYKMLAINPGSTSTKIALYQNGEFVFIETIRHSIDIINSYSTIYDQFHFRKKIIMDKLVEKKVDITKLDAIVSRGGNMKPVEGGTYRINKEMVEDLKKGVMGQHASNLGGIIAFDIASQYKLSSFVVDPVVVDELEELARISGIPEISRKSKDHPLNQKAVARKAAKELGDIYQGLNFIVVHLGGGISIGTHKKGKIIDVNNCLDGDGPFSPERSGGVPIGSLVDMCFSGNYTKGEIRKKIVGNGGLVGYLGTNDTREVVKRIEEGDKFAERIYKAMAYQVSKEIGAAATVLSGKIDAIVLTGGVANDKMFVKLIKNRVNFLAPIKVYPGEFEMEALVEGVCRVLEGKEEEKLY